MALRELLQRLLGTDVSDRSEPGFVEQSDSEGLLFALPQAQFKKVAGGAGSIIARMQYITLTMLVEQGLAEAFPNGFHLAPEQVCGLDEESAEILHLPQPFTGSFSTLR